MIDAAPTTRRDAPKTRTGRARTAMAEALRADFEDVRSSLSAAVELAEDLATESGGVNGVAIWWRSVAQKLVHERKALDQKIEEITSSLTTYKSPAVADSSTDEELLKRVRQARGEEAA